MSMLRVVSGMPLFFIYLLQKQITLKWSFFCIITYLIAFIAHYIGRGALLNHNLSNCIECTLHWNGCSFVSEFFKVNFLRRSHFLCCRLYNLCSICSPINAIKKLISTFLFHPIFAVYNAPRYKVLG